MLAPRFPIETARLTLRPFAAGDLDDLYAYNRLEEVARYLYWTPRDRQETAAVLDHKITNQSALKAEGDSLVLAVESPADGHVIGDVNLKWRSEEHRQGEVGFVFNPRYGGRGFATEAVEVMLRLGFEEFGLHRIVGECDPRNEPSWRLMERLGMRREAYFRQNEIFKGEWGDLYVYAILAEEWRARAGVPARTSG